MDTTPRRHLRTTPRQIIRLRLHSNYSATQTLTNPPSKFEPPISCYRLADLCILSDEITDYHVVSQGKTEIPGVDDGYEMLCTDVRIGSYSTLISILLLLLSIVQNYPDPPKKKLPTNEPTEQHS